MPAIRPPAPTNARGRRRGGFSLAEILVVVAVVSLLLTLAGPIVRQSTRGESPSAIATRIAAELERAKTTAVSRNTFVWTYLGPRSDEPETLQLVAWESTDGTPDPDRLAPAGRTQRFENLALQPALPDYGGRPHVPAADRPAGAVWLRFSPSGEVHGTPATASDSPEPPSEIPGRLSRWIEIGLQSTRGGKTPAALQRDTAVLHIAGLTGQIRRFAP